MLGLYDLYGFCQVVMTYYSTFRQGRQELNDPIMNYKVTK